MNKRNIFKILLIFSSLLFCSQSFAYVIYNKTDTSLRVTDLGDRGIDMSIPVHGSVACSPFASGCSGWKHFKIRNNLARDYKVFCEWIGIIPKAKGNYFVITKSTDPNTPCKIEYYRA